MSIDTSKIKDQARDGIAEALGDAYDCMRVWSAWGVGTMGPDDFALVVEDESRLEEITDAALAPALAVIDAQAAEIAALRTNAEYGIKEREFLHAEAERLKKALRVAVLALAHATQEHGKVYEPAYNAVDAALSGESNG
ncbi:hypothetical protein CBF45_07335 [Bordetella sp. J329]|nr:hypothetical protein CBF45_07335 [Bordetella sp. J329]